MAKERNKKKEARGEIRKIRLRQRERGERDAIEET